ncbi:MAG: B12-binding domain-containing radical SAM protein [Candidatus Lindowbacteria bacterium]|nr:B12-binding domain-containing radical SAM protein [Candidatus Lindowbacteria bacterium]
MRIANCLDRRHPAATSLPGPSRARSYAHGRGKFSHEVIPKPARIAIVPRKYKRYGIPLEAFRKEISGGAPPDAIGVGSMMTYWSPGVAETIALARETWPGVPVILGGVYATLCASHAKKYAGADYVVEGPGEEEFVRILRDIIGGAGGGQSNSCEHARDSSPKKTGLRMTFMPAYHLLQKLDSVSMLTSFGCPFACAYCASRLLRRGFVQRPVAEVVDEIAFYVQQMNIHDIAFCDDALLVNPDRHIKPILREVIGRGLRARFHTPNGLHADMIDEELAGLMKAAGFATVRLSLESIDPVRLRDSCVKVTPDGFRRAVSNLFAAGYGAGDIEAYALMGVPGQREKEVEETIRFARDAGAVVRLSDFSPIPGTSYFEAAKREYGIELADPLLQNSSVYPYLVPGLREQYARLKALAQSVNSDLLRRRSLPRCEIVP